MPATTPSDLDRLSAGTLAWLGRHLDHFDPYAAPARPAEHGRAKAALELALLCHLWARRAGADDSRLGRATAVLRTVWQHPDLPRLLTADPRCAVQYALVGAALAPGGTDTAACRAALARLAPDGLSPHGTSPYQRLELRHYADKAGVPHTIEPYEELLGRNFLVRLPAELADRTDRAGGAGGAGGADPGAAPVTVPEAYALTHSSFYFSDFGRTASGLSGKALADAAELVRRLLEHSVRHDWWDLAAELVMTQVCLGLDPLGTPWGRAAVDCLARAQRPDGALPGRSAATAAADAEPAGSFFAKAYHTTLVTALMTLLLRPETTLPTRPAGPEQPALSEPARPGSVPPRSVPLRPVPPRPVLPERAS
ncbi:DUF6895 family protein [Kitasatospora sp. NBC_00458]|uniref:DUF6895 family protein n=1 Tax=Kitasatospora sp. NBC_00458 TaxID=2903568 RepID=UPI002E181A0B